MTTPSWMCPHCGKRPVTELGATSCEECAKPVATVEVSDDRHVEAIVSAKMKLAESEKSTAFKVKDPALAVALALQGILTVQIELLESQPDALDFSLPEMLGSPPEPPDAPMGPRPWGQ